MYNEQRANDMFTMRIAGKTYKEIGAKYDVSSARAIQIINKHVRILKHANNKNIQLTKLNEEFKGEINNLNMKMQALHGLALCAIKLKDAGVYDLNLEAELRTPISLYDAELSVRTHSVLEKYFKIDNLYSLEFISEDDLLAAPNFGRKSFNELKYVTRHYNIIIGSKIKV